METVEAVALWAGLLSGVVATALALVSIAFTYLVEKRSSEINNQIIQTLQKIESAVERTTDDTANLIKVAWERMLPAADSASVGTPVGQDSMALAKDAAKEIASGVAAELRAGLIPPNNEGQPSNSEINDAIARLQTTVEAQLGSASVRSRRSRQNALYQALEGLSPKALTLLAALTAAGSHLEADEYQRLYDGPLNREVRELRDEALLIPLAGHNTGEEGLPVYWLPPNTAGAVRGLIQVLDMPVGRDADLVDRELTRIGYAARVDARKIDGTRPG
jgi:hypothetical protein